MIKLSLDEAYCFDFLSIIDVKCSKTSNNLEDYFNKYKTEIINQIGNDLYNKIINSSEYKDLFNTNYKLFSVIDLAKKGGIDALKIDQLNYNRYKIKKKIQEKFFGTETKEIKIGYE